MNEEQIKTMLISGSVDQLLDALDFGPDGVKDLIKSFAVSIPLRDIEKMAAIKDKTGFDVSAALRHLEEERLAAKEESKEETTSEPKQRRVQPEENAGRRTTPQYKVISEQKD